MVHALYYVAGEMWIAVCIAIVIDIVPNDITASAIAVFFFVIQILGGNMPLLVPPLQTALGSMRGALLILFSGMILLSVFVFALLLFWVKPKEEAEESDAEFNGTTMDVCIPVQKNATDNVV